MATRTRHIGLSLGADICWPICYEALLNELDLAIDVGGETQRFSVERVGIEDPVVDDTIGVFVDPRLAELYEDMVSEGSRSSIAALQVGATIEEVDMVDIQAAIGRAETPAIIELYESLLCGSRNHLRAFTDELESAGEPYDAQFLDPAEVEAIISSPREQCRTP